jgi:hypothetical protein
VNLGERGGKVEGGGSEGVYDQEDGGGGEGVMAVDREGEMGRERGWNGAGRSPVGCGRPMEAG